MEQDNRRNVPQISQCLPGARLLLCTNGLHVPAPGNDVGQLKQLAANVTAFWNVRLLLCSAARGGVKESVAHSALHLG